MGSFGESLKRERELRDISLREIADATKISVRYLEALEQNRFEVLPGGVFNKGFIRAYANFIGANVDALVDTYLQEVAAREQVAPGAAEAGRPGAEGLHRPAEAPKRRSADLAAPSASSGDGRPPASPPAAIQMRAPDISLEKLAAAIDERRAMERAALGGRSRSRLLVLSGSFFGSAVLVFALLLVARAVTQDPSPALDAGEMPAAQVLPSDEPGESDPAPPPAAPGSAVAGEATAEPGSDPPPDTAALADPAPAAVSPPGGERGDEPSVNRARVPVPNLPPPAASVTARPPATTPARAPALTSMDLRLEVIQPALVQVSCDGEDRLNRPLLPGEMATMRCFNLIRVSATDAGALRLVVNGRRCASLGEPGSRIQGFAIRNDDVDSICPARGGASDARP